MFEQHSRSIIGLERLMLEASGFDFRNRHPQKLMIKLAKLYGVEKGSALIKTAYCMSLDLYRTFAPLKQSTPTMAFACLELSSRLLDVFDTFEVARRDYAVWNTTRAEIMGMANDQFRSKPLLTKRCRDHARPPRTLHSPPFLHIRWPRIRPRPLPLHPHPTQPGRSAPLHRLEEVKRKEAPSACYSHWSRGHQWRCHQTSKRDNETKYGFANEPTR